jgi:hypothetical protein
MPLTIPAITTGFQLMLSRFRLMWRRKLKTWDLGENLPQFR